MPASAIVAIKREWGSKQIEDQNLLKELGAVELIESSQNGSRLWFFRDSWDELYVVERPAGECFISRNRELDWDLPVWRDKHPQSNPSKKFKVTASVSFVYVLENCNNLEKKDLATAEIKALSQKPNYIASRLSEDLDYNVCILEIKDLEQGDQTCQKKK